MGLPRKRAKSETQTHIRRCHKCNGITESAGQDVKQCEHCGKHMAPFYFFNDNDVEAHTDQEPRPLRPHGKVIPVLGFTAYW